MELDLWIEPEGSSLLKVQESAGCVALNIGESSKTAVLDRADVRTLYLSLKYWYELGEDA